MIGAAVFKEGKMIGKLTGEELRFAIELNPYKHIKSMMVTYQDPENKKYRVVGRRVERELDLKFDKNGKKPTFYVHLKSTFEILGIPSFISYTTNLKKQEILKKTIEKQLEEKINALVKKTQKEYEGEPFCWSYTVRREFLTIKDYTQFDWMKSYPDIDVKVEVDVRVKDFGKNGGLPKLKEIRD